MDGRTVYDVWGDKNYVQYFVEREARWYVSRFDMLASAKDLVETCRAHPDRVRLIGEGSLSATMLHASPEELATLPRVGDGGMIHNIKPALHVVPDPV